MTRREARSWPLRSVAAACLIVVAACTSGPPQDAVDLAEAVAADPLFHTTTPRGTTERIGTLVDTGGERPQTPGIEVSRSWDVDSDPAEGVQSLVEAATDAGWQSVTVECHDNGAYEVGGHKTFDHTTVNLWITTSSPSLAAALERPILLGLTAFAPWPSDADDDPPVEDIPGDTSCLTAP